MAKQMTDAEQKQLVEKARVLYAEGAPAESIANSIGVAPGTVRRWARESEAAGTPWPREAAPPPRRRRTCTGNHAAVPDRRPATSELRALLEKRLAHMVAQSARTPEEAGAEDRMLKVCKVLEFLDSGDDLRAQLRTVKNFAAFCVQTLSESEMAPVRKAIHLFLDKLRQENS